MLSAVTALGATLTREVATGLLTAIAMDTGWFRHTNTRPGTLRGGRADRSRCRYLRDLPRPVRAQHPGAIAAHGRDAVGIANRHGGKSGVRHDFVGRPGTHRSDSPGLGRPHRFHGQLAWSRGGPAVHRTVRGGVKVSLRSRNGLDCSRLAAKLGGGGHRAAAGATLAGPMAENVDRVLREVRRALDLAPIPAQG